MTTNETGTRPLPDGWTWTKLSEACHIELGQSPPSSTYNTEGIGLPFFQGKAEFGDLYPTPVKWCSAPQKIAEAGDVLISVRAPVGSTNLNHEKSCIGRGLAAIRPNEGMSNRYFLYLLRHIEQELIDQATGTTFQAISGRVLREQKIPLAPIPEQERIVAEIEKQFTRLDQAVASMRRLQTSLARYKATVLKAACCGRLVPQDPDDEPADELLQRILNERRGRWQATHPGKKYTEPTPVDTSNLPDLPNGWVWVSWQQVGFSQNGRSFPSKEYQSDGFKLLRPGNLHMSGKIVWNEQNTRYMPNSWAEQYPDFIVGGQELIMNLTAQSLKDEFLGRVCLTDEREQCLLNQRIARLTPIIVSPKYLLWMFKSQIFRSFVNGLNTGSLIQHMFTSQLAEFALPLPPLAEQHRIVAEVERRLSVVTTLEQTITANLARAERLRQSILHRAFSGRLV